MSISRIDFIRLNCLGLLSLPLLGSAKSFFETSGLKDSKLNVNLFSKHLQFLGYEDMSEAAAEMGFDGLDLTVRPNGHILPERAADDLPMAIEAMKAHGLKALMMTTNITDINSKEDIQILETASENGLNYYRMGWLKYPEDKSIQSSIETYKQQFENLDAFNRSHGLKAGYQNHAGNHVGAPIWDIDLLLNDNPTNSIGCQYDIRHATLEGGSSWQLGLKLIKDHINSIVIKDFKWGKKDGKWLPINVPLGEGMVDFKTYFSLLKQYEINVPVSLHLEYDLGGAEHGDRKISISNKEVFKRMKQDLEYLRKSWATA